MLLLKHNLNFKHDLAELRKERCLDHSLYFQLYWEVAALCLCQTNLAKSESIHLGTQHSLHLSSSKKEKRKRMEYPTANLFKTDFKKNHHCVYHRMSTMGRIHTLKQLPGPVPSARLVFLTEPSPSLHFEQLPSQRKATWKAKF